MIKSPPMGFTEDNFCAVVRASDPQAKDIKTETRRLLKLKGLSQKLTNELQSFYQDGDGNWIGWANDSPHHSGMTKELYPKGSNKGIKSKYQVGDRCYLTEPTQILTVTPEDSIDIEDCEIGYFWGKKKTTYEGISDRKWVELSDGDSTKICNRKTGIYSKQIARFMLKSFARYWVEITDVRIERLLDITEEAAIAEGVKYIKRPELACPVYFDYVRNEYLFADPKDSYISEIEMLHGKAIAQSNPWLWVYKFKLIGENQ